MVLRLAVVLLILAQVQGCAIPPSVLTLTPEEAGEARDLLTRFTTLERPVALDADVHLSWETLTGTQSVDATVQAVLPDKLRLSLLDPLGRPFFILASDGTTYRALDISEAIIHTGTVASGSWQEYFPVDIPAELLVSTMLGTLCQEQTELTPAGRDQAGNYWYDGRSSGQDVRVLLDRHSARLKTLQLPKQKGMEMRYTGEITGAGGQLFPRQIEVDMSGALRLVFQHIYPINGPFGATVFQPEAPAHFREEKRR
ncbi:MAG: hypothetical protein CSA34_01530 [Desulfobulbus propionicus]|nr:MAG: hypothetical protein CSA34_01530 [Desulfobulbus propionicus]